LPTTLVTGATGFLGSHLARVLVERGDDVRVNVRPASRLDALEGLEVERVTADILDARAMAGAVRGVDRVFHVAGSTRVRDGEDALHRVNATGTRVVLEACLRAGVERVVHTSSAAALGPAPRGSTADETQGPRPRDLAEAPHAAAKHAAEQEALRAAARGLPVVVASPSRVFGPGDHLQSSTDVVRRFLVRRIPAFVDGAISVVDVRDVAVGLVLAAERGTPGERYVLADRNYTWDRLFADLGRLSGVEPPAVKLSVPAALALAGTARALPIPGRPHVAAARIRAAAHYWTYRSTKARRELGWTTRPHEETVEATVAWWRARLGDAVHGGRQPVALRMTGSWMRRAEELASRLAD
jgi:dihydroflavonol-4-reductase